MRALKQIAERNSVSNLSHGVCFDQTCDLFEAQSLKTQHFTYQLIKGYCLRNLNEILFKATDVIYFYLRNSAENISPLLAQILAALSVFFIVALSLAMHRNSG